MMRLLAVVPLLMLLGGCAHRVQVVARQSSSLSSETLVLNKRPLEIRLSKPHPTSANDALIIFATGDGGWHDLDEELFRWIRAENHPVAGFSSKDYLKGLDPSSGITTPRGLARDFEHIIHFAESQLQLPRETPIILAGCSRGAGLAVVAAGQGRLKPHLVGVVAIALTKEEEHVVRSRRAVRRGTRPGGAAAEIQTYDYLHRLAEFPVAVIQSTNDGYLPAQAARALFGPDTDLRKFMEVKARNHRFSGGWATLYQDTKVSLAWVRERGLTTASNLDHSLKGQSSAPLRH